MTPKTFDSEIAAKIAELPPDVLELMKGSGLLTDEVNEAARLAEEALLKKDKCTYYLSKFITESPTLKRMKEQVAIVAETDDPVLITGPTGTGKEIIANALHGKRPGEFVDVNCAGLPENLIESELFGHVKGAFTDAKTDKRGMLEAAVNGTVFLDEIGDMPLPVQAKLLRALQEKKVRRVGSTESVDISCRFVAATHQNLERMVDAGSFRTDLYWRLSVIEFTITPLATRMSDVIPLLKYYDTDKAIKDYVTFAKHINDTHLAGNVRSLQRIIRRYTLFKEMP